MRGAHAGDVFTISLHQEDNYPAWKPPSSIDVDLPDGITDNDYLAWLDNALSSGLRQFTPDLICYIAGADPYREDQLGGLGLTIDGLKKRDELVFRVAKSKNIPVMVMAAEASYHQAYDHCTAKYLNQAGVKTEYIRLQDKGIYGNGHMVMIEKNNLDIARLVDGWLQTNLR